MSCIRICTAMIALWAAIGCSYAQAAVFSVDGNLSDWGITLGASQHFNYAAGYNYSYHSGLDLTGTRGQAIIGGNAVCYDLEDSNDDSNSYQVGPLYGGQNYDAEVLVASVVGSNLYIGVASGQRPNNGLAYFAPGDIRIAAGQNVFAIEVVG